VVLRESVKKQVDYALNQAEYPGTTLFLNKSIWGVWCLYINTHTGQGSDKDVVCLLHSDEAKELWKDSRIRFGTKANEWSHLEEFDDVEVL
jgi:hypothetical protein